MANNHQIKIAVWMQSFKIQNMFNFKNLIYIFKYLIWFMHLLSINFFESA